MKRLALLLAGGLLACASQIPDKVDLKPEAENVEFAYETPSADAYKLIGTVKGVAAAEDPDQAQEAAKNDLRNKAAELGAVIVTIDENTGALMPLQSRTKVTLVGRAYKPLD